MCFAKSTAIDKIVVPLLKRLPSGWKGRLIELASRSLRWGFDRFPVLKRTIVCEITLGLEGEYGIREELAAAYLRGSGIEIGALHAPLRLPKGTRALYVDKFPTDFLKSQYPELSGRKFVNVDIVDDGECLATIADGSQDFVIANHFVEHCQDPIRAIGNMVRVLREDGILYIALPDKRFTFDQDRPVTTVEHLLSDYRCGPAGSRRDHLEEWFRLVNKIEDYVERENAVDKALQSEDHIHYHVWTQTEMLELIVTLQGFYHLELESVRKNGIELVVVLRKVESSS
jgi:SAM-dependent methyltransferase